MVQDTLTASCMECVVKTTESLVTGGEIGVGLTTIDVINYSMKTHAKQFGLFISI